MSNPAQLKLLRYNMEALQKYRSGGKQSVTVQNVNVENGGQAIVGSVTKGKARVDAFRESVKG